MRLLCGHPHANFYLLSSGSLGFDLGPQPYELYLWACLYDSSGMAALAGPFHHLTASCQAAATAYGESRSE